MCILEIHEPAESMCFHPDASWLTEHGNLREKAEGIEVYRDKDCIKERGFMPMVLLHELGRHKVSVHVFIFILLVRR